jgi:predicted dehydrogenase
MKPCRVALVGGGRWARVYASVLAENPDAAATVTIVSPRNADGMRRWVVGHGLPYAVTAEQGAIGCDAAIVANAAADHEASAERFLKARIPTLVEKPFALSGASATRLIDLSWAQSTLLATAFVFKFAPYLERFASFLPDRSQVTAVSVTWTDPAAESRYGEPKSHDPRLPILVDVLPHILSVLGTILSVRQVACRAVTVERGGALNLVDLSLDRTPCNIRLARNADKRERLIEVATDRRPFLLDFSIEPGWIFVDGDKVSGDPDWGCGPSPLTRLVRSFLAAASGEACDDRLNAGHGLLACRVADQALRHYDAALMQWLEQPSARGAIDPSDFAYAASELGMNQPSRDQLLAALKRRADER